jgi:tRNA-modifying protein YgfZ
VPEYVPLADRNVLGIAGDDARTFLQGLISNDVRRVSPERAIWAAFLTPQGKYLFDFFVCEQDGRLLLDCEGARLMDLRRRLSMYKLRSKVIIEPADLAVWAVIGDGLANSPALPPMLATALTSGEPGEAALFAGGVAFVDPRHSGAGLRLVLPAAAGPGVLAQQGWAEGSHADYDRLRLRLGLPDGSRDMLIEKSLLLECGFDELNGIDWQKGCYLGQELTARTRYRGLVKKRLLTVAVEGPLPAAGTPVMLDGKEVGEVRSGADGAALALLRLEALEADGARTGGLSADAARLIPSRPDWARF